MNAEEFINYLVEDDCNKKSVAVSDKKKLRIPVFAQIISSKLKLKLKDSEI